MKEDRFTNTVADAAEYERHRDPGDDDRPTRADVTDRYHEDGVCDECGDELDASGHCGWCDGDND